MRKRHHPFSPSFHNRMHSLYPISALGFNRAQRLQRFSFLPPFRLIVTMSLNSEGSRCNACNFWITCFKRSSLLAIAYFSPSRGLRCRYQQPTQTMQTRTTPRGWQSNKIESTGPQMTQQNSTSHFKPAHQLRLLCEIEINLPLRFSHC